MTATPSFSKAPADLSDLLASHGRYLQSMGGAVRMGRQLKLEHVDFGAINWQRKLLDHVALAHCRLSCSDLRHSSFQEASLPACDFSAADLSGADFSGADLRGADLSRAVLTKTRFIATGLGPYRDGDDEGGGRTTRMTGAVIKGTSFARAVLDGVQFDRADLDGADFAFARLENVEFGTADLRRVDFGLADLGPGMAEAVTAAGGRPPKRLSADEVDAVLASHADWIASNGRKGSRAGLQGACLIDASLAHADLSGADLSGANLAGADLGGARLICTDLRGANLSRAKLGGADFRGAMLDGSHGFLPSGSL
ncbi:pentapeptide repeat-containing protein [Ferrovibrio sp.]|uniref:pentapeptide repeat-containing protein n=1 Tax=Ferrovibrio sp. TaxID=1917215 RepID=UPI00311F7ACC